MANTTGLECKAYLGSGTFASPTWTELTQAQEVTISRERTEITAPSRGSTFEKVLVGLKKVGVDIKLLRDNTNASQIILDAAYEAGTTIFMAFADGPIATTGTRYVKVEVLVTKFAEGEPLEGAATIDMMVKPSAKGTNDPAKITV